MRGGVGGNEEMRDLSEMCDERKWAVGCSWTGSVRPSR